MMSLNSGYQCVIAEPVYPMVKDVLQPTLEKVLRALGFKYEYSASDLRYKVIWRGGYGHILLRSSENWRRMAGLNIWGYFQDEADLNKDSSAWQMGVSRLREGNVFTASGCSTPEGYGWVWEKWVNNPKDGYELIKAKTEANTFLPDEYIESLKQNYDKRLLKAYMDGEFINLQRGQTYYTFDREKNVRKNKYNPALPIRIGNDQNVDPMCSVLWQKYDTTPKIRVFDEVVIRHGGGNELMTERMCNEIKARYPNKEYMMYPDASSLQRRTSSRRTDFQIMRDCGMNIIMDRRNPMVVDRVNCVNKAMESLIIDPSCKVMIRDLEQVVNREGTRDIDKTNKELSHISDALGYSLYKTFPLHKVNIKAMQR